MKNLMRKIAIWTLVLSMTIATYGCSKKKNNIDIQTPSQTSSIEQSSSFDSESSEDNTSSNESQTTTGDESASSSVNEEETTKHGQQTTTKQETTTKKQETTTKKQETTTKKQEVTTTKKQETSNKEEETTTATGNEQIKYKLSKQSYDYVCAYDTNNQTYVVEKNGKYGVVTFDGTVKIDIKYEEFNLVGENLEFILDGTAYVFNQNFKKIFEYVKKEVIANPDAYKIYYHINNEKYEFELFNWHLWDPEEVTEQVDGNSYVNRILYNDILIETYTYFSRINWQGVFVNKYKFINITTGDVICEEFGLKYGLVSAEGLFWCEGLIISQFDSKDVILLSADEHNEKVYLYSITDESFSKKELTNVYTLLQGVTNYVYGVEWITFYDDSYGKPFIMNTKTLEIIYSEYDEYEVESFFAGRNGLYGAKKYDNEYYDLIKGYSIISTGYEGLDFSDDTYIRAWKDGKCIFMDYNGKKIAEFEKATGFVYGKALVSDGTGLYYVDESFNKISEYIYKGKFDSFGTTYIIIDSKCYLISN